MTAQLEEKANDKRREYMREWRAKNEDKRREYMREWRRKNKDKVKEYNRRYWERKAADQEGKEVKANEV